MFDPLKKLDELSEKGYHDLLHFFDWLFGFEEDQQKNQDNSRSFGVPVVEHLSTNSTYPYGLTNVLGGLFPKSSNQIQTELGKEAVNEIKNSRNEKDFVSKTESTETKDIQDSMIELSNLVATPKSDTADVEQYRNEIKTVVDKAKNQCRAYIKNHEGDRWTPTNVVKKAYVDNVLKTVDKLENLANMQVPQEVVEDINSLAKNPYKIARLNRTYEYKKGSHQVSDIKKFFRPVDLKLFDIKEKAPDLIELGYQYYPDKKDNELKEHEKHARKVLDILQKFSVTKRGQNVLKDNYDLVQSDKKRKKSKWVKTENSDYDVRASELYKEINEYIRLCPDELKNPDSLAFRFKQLKDSVFAEGTLEVPEKDKGIFIDATGKSEVDDELNFDGDKDLLFSAQTLDEYKGESNANKTTYMRDCSNEPLFPKEPHPSDIVQGRVGDCYFISYLSKMAQEDPEGIKDMFKDNGDGTVTCRFYNGERQPIYVTVNKTIPYDRVKEGNDTVYSASNGERVPLWVHMAEKAYMMSGLRPMTEGHLKEHEDTYIKKHPEYKTTDEYPTPLAKKLYQKRFGDVPFDPIRYSKLLEHGYYGLDGGCASRVARDLTGKNAYECFFNRTGLYELYVALTDEDAAKYKRTDLFGEKVKAILEEQPDIAKFIMKNAADNLYNENQKSKNAKGVKNPVYYFTIKQLEGHILNFKKTDQYKEYKSKNPGIDEYEKVAKTLVSCMKETQKNNNGRTGIIADNESGPEHYSKYDNGLFDFMTKKLDKGLHVGASYGGHEYSVMGYKIEDGKKKLVLRNPWGHHGEKEDVEYNSLENRSKDHDKSKTELGGLLEIEINEFTAKGNSFDFEEENKVMSMDDMQNTIAKQLVDAFISEQEPEKQEKLRRSMTTPESMAKYKEQPFIQKISKMYMENEAIKFHAEKTGEIPVEIFYKDIKKLTDKWLKKDAPVKHEIKEKSVEEVIREKSRLAKNEGYLSNKDVKETVKKELSDQNQAAF